MFSISRCSVYHIEMGEPEAIPRYHIEWENRRQAHGSTFRDYRRQAPGDWRISRHNRSLPPSFLVCRAASLPPALGGWGKTLVLKTNSCPQNKMESTITFNLPNLRR